MSHPLECFHTSVHSPHSQLFMDAHHSSRIEPLPAFSFVVGTHLVGPHLQYSLEWQSQPPFVDNHSQSGHAGTRCRRRYVRASLIANAAGVGTRSTPLMSPPVGSARETAQCAEAEDGNGGERDDLEPLHGVFSCLG